MHVGAGLAWYLYVTRRKLQTPGTAEEHTRHVHQHVPLRVQSVSVVGGVNVLVDTAM